MAPGSPDTAAMPAGRAMLKGIERIARQGIEFSFETTLSGRMYVKLLQNLRDQGYSIHLYFLWVPDVELSLSRIRERVAQGGHDVPPDVVRRRFDRSIRNFFRRYQQLVNIWFLFDNSKAAPSVIAFEKEGKLHIINKELYGELKGRYT